MKIISKNRIGLVLALLAAALVIVIALALVISRGRNAAPPGLDAAAFSARYVEALQPLDPPQSVYHLGHSLTGRDMPAILAQVSGHAWNSQLGWGASLNDHRIGKVAGMVEENATSAFRPVGEAIDSGDYPVVVLTEMVELKDAIRYHDSANALAFWAKRIREARPDARIYLYETWHGLKDPGDWLGRIDADLATLWEGDVLRPAMAVEGTGTIHVIPGGQVMAAVSRAGAEGRLPGITGPQSLLSDDIHFNDTGAWLMAMVHYAVIYGRSPVGLPVDVTRADGSPIDPIDPGAARLMQEIAWDVVRAYPPAGVVGGAEEAP